MNTIKNRKVLIPLLLIIAIVVIGTSFALWQLTFTQSGTNVITTGCLKLTLTEEADAINLVDATPISDEEGKSLTPFTFTLENVCTTETEYVVNLETLSSGDKILADNYVKANLISGDNELFIDNLLSKHINEEKVIEEASIAYKLYQGKLGNKEKISFSLRLWMDEATEALDEVMNASWQGKITVTASYVPPKVKSNVMKQMEFEAVNDPLTSTRIEYNITYTKYSSYYNSKIVFQNKLEPYTNAIEVVDFSEEQDGSILGYYVKDETNDSMYNLYIQADGKIKVNKIASYYFFDEDDLVVNDKVNSVQIEGIENLDISQVVDMSFMFYKSNMEVVDINSWDMSQVTDMSFMFYQASNLITTINITNPNVENYGGMFTEAATEEGAQITVNYTAETEDLVDRMIQTKSENSNVVKGSLIS